MTVVQCNNCGEWYCLFCYIAELCINCGDSFHCFIIDNNMCSNKCEEAYLDECEEE